MQIASEEGTLEQVADAAFDDAFDTAEEKLVATEKEDKPDKSDIEEEPEIDKEPEKEEQPVKADKVTKPEQQAGESDEAYEQRWKTLQGIYRHEKDEWQAEKTRIQAELEELKAKVPKPAENKEDGDDSGLKDLLAKLDLTDEQKAELAQYDEEFDIVSKMEGLKREKAITKLKAEMLETFNTLKKDFQSQLEPAVTFAKETAATREEEAKEAHFQRIREKHSDFETYRDDGSLSKWIEAKPTYLKKALEQVCSQGTADDIVELLDDFKAENNITKEQGNVEPDTQTDKTKSSRRAALIPPNTRRGAVNASMNVASDFEGAFDEAINKRK